MNNSERIRDRAEKAMSTIVFIQARQSILEQLGYQGLDESIPLPVQLPGPVARFDASMITEESIITGILRFLAWKPDAEHAEYYRTLVKALRPSLLEELSNAGIAKAEAHEWEVAEEIFLALAGLYPEKPEILLDLAMLHEEHAKALEQEQDEECAEAEDDAAYDYYKMLLGREPPYAPAYYYAALFFLRKKTFDRASSLLTTFISLSDDERRVQKAKDILAKLKKLGYLDTTFKEAFDFIRMGEDEKGLAKAQEFIERYPDVWNGWFLAGWAHRKLRNWEKGKEAFQKAIDLGSEEADTFNEMALCQLETGDFTGARTSLERALRFEPENVKIIANLGALEYRMGRTAEARGFFEAAVEMDPDDTVSKTWLEKLDKEAGGE